MALPPATQEVLDLLYALITEHGDWPTWEIVDDQLDRRIGLDEPWSAVDRIDRRLLRAVGHLTPPPGQQVGLSLAGMACCKSAEEDLRIFTDSVRVSATLAREAPPPPHEVVVKSADLPRLGVQLPASGQSDVIWRQRLWWESAHGLWSSSARGSEARTWSFTLRRPSIRRLRDVRDADAMLRIVDPEGIAALADLDVPEPSMQAPVPALGLGAQRTETFECSGGLTYVVDLDDPLGDGGQGSVYRGRSTAGDVVAIKKIPLRSFNTDRWFLDASYAEREALLGRLLVGRGLRHVMPMLDSALETEALYVVYPLAERSLDTLITSLHGDSSTERRREADGNEVEILSASKDLASGLAELHESGVLHRDIKPSNALFYDGRWVWSDLGIGRLIEATTASHTWLGWGTDEYMAPEVAMGERATVKSDVYSLGCTMYALALGHPPFQGDDLRRQHREASPSVEHIDDDLLRWALQLCLAKSPGSRPSAPELHQMLSEPAGGGSSAILRSIASSVIKRQASRAAAESQHEARQRAVDDARDQFEIIWGRFVRTVKAAYPAATSAYGDEGWQLTLQDRQIRITFAEPADPGTPALLLGCITICVPGTDERRTVANLIADLTQDREPGWRILRMVRNDLHPSRTPVPESYADRWGAVGIATLEEHLRERGKRVVVSAVTTRDEKALTDGALTDLFARQVEALDGILDHSGEH